MKKMNKALRFLGYLVVVLAVAGMLGFVESSKSAAVCEGMEIKFVDGDSLQLVTENDIRRAVISTEGEPVGKNLRAIDFDGMEEMLRSLPHLRHVAVYSTVDRLMKIEVEERKAMIRLIDEGGTSMLMDTEGFLMPLSKAAVLRLPVFTGRFNLHPGMAEANLHIGDSLAPESLVAVYDLAKLVAEDPFGRAQFQQVVMEKNGDLLAYPQVGNHTIIFGKNDFDEKLKRLKIFYRKGMNTENWNKYSSINLKYKNQIVCTKK